MKNLTKKITPAIACGILTAATIFYVIPRFFMKGISDVIWIILMLFFPIVIAIITMRLICKRPPKYVFWGLLPEFLTALLLYKPLGAFLGYQLNSFAWDMFDFIAYYIFVLGWALAATLTQFLFLALVSKIRK